MGYAWLRLVARVTQDVPGHSTIIAIEHLRSSPSGSRITNHESRLISPRAPLTSHGTSLFSWAYAFFPSDLVFPCVADYGNGAVARFLRGQAGRHRGDDHKGESVSLGGRRQDHPGGGSFHPF